MNQLRNPIPGTTQAQNRGYAGDTGLDIGVPVGTPCYAVADGWIVYSEPGHTPWVADAAHPHDTANSVLLSLKEPFSYKGHRVTYAWYTHLSKLAHRVPDGSTPLEVKAGDLIGWTGTGNNNPHLHLGLISNRAQEEGQTMPFPLVAELIWDQAAPVPPAAAKELELTVYLHGGKHSVRLRNAGELDGVYQVLEPNIGDGFLRFGLGLVKPA